MQNKSYILVDQNNVNIISLDKTLECFFYFTHACV